MDNLNNSQKLAAEHSTDEHVLVLAGAGCGKTRTIIARALVLISRGVAPERILLLTFTRRSAAEMQERMAASNYEGSKRILAGTFHYFALLMIRRYSASFGGGRYTVIDADDQNDMMKLARQKAGQDNTDMTAAQLTQKFSYIRNSCKPVYDYLIDFEGLDEEEATAVEAIFKEYQRLKAEKGYLDFDDLLFFLKQVLENDAEARAKISGLFDHILVDETQDTNPLQWQILQGLINPARLFCVGDDAQSIYAFRGADFRNVHLFSERVPGGKIIKLEENYRSTQGILDLANHLLAKSPLDYDKNLVAHRGEGALPELVDFSSPYDEAAWIADDMVSHRKEGLDWKDFMVLTRTAFASRVLEGVLIAREIPYRFIGGTSLLRAAHVKDLLAFLRAASSTKDLLGWIRFLSCWTGIGEIIAKRIASKAEAFAEVPQALESLMQSDPKHREKFEAIGSLRMNFLGDLPRLISKALLIMSPLLEKRYADNWSMRRKDIDVLISLAEKFPSVEEFIETYTLDPISAASATNEDETDTVTLITVHSAKGTEAPQCYILQAQPGMYPHTRSIGDFDSEEEERRILYVAITRAMDRLVITRSMDNAGNVFWGGSTSMPSRPENSYFLGDVDSFVESKNASFAYSRPRRMLW